ncbi:MAG: hypothetical protein CMJ62_06860 [Planctomycetaceae bacterium]|jgi:hypothetical protein|nr:hypothetical protein [Planctomycetaceae bacterium]
MITVTRVALEWISSGDDTHATMLPSVLKGSNNQSTCKEDSEAAGQLLNKCLETYSFNKVTSMSDSLRSTFPTHDETGFQSTERSQFKETLLKHLVFEDCLD